MSISQGSSKIRPLAELSGLIPEGSSVALGGAWFSNHPMAAVRQLIRDRVSGIHLIETMGSVDIDLLVAAGSLKSLTFSMVSLESFGLPRHFRAAAQNGDLELREMTGCALQTAIDAGARNIPFTPIVEVGSSDLPVRQTWAYAKVTDPFTGLEVDAVRAIRPDVAIIHVTRADASGNAQTDGGIATDPELARSARKVILTCEEIVSREEIAADPNRTVIPGFLVDSVIHAPFGAHPTSHVPSYAFDAWSVRDYVRETADDDGSAAYLAKLRSESEAEYRDRFLSPHRAAVLRALATTDDSGE